MPRLWLSWKILSFLGFRRNVVFINTTWGVEIRDRLQINCLILITGIIREMGTTMYDVTAMKEKLENATLFISTEIRDTFKTAIINIYKDNKASDAFDQKEPPVTKVVIESIDDLNAISYGPGLYIILSNYEVDGNECTLRCGDLRAIYRGECYTLKQRVMSHLFHSKYKENYEVGRRTYEADSKNTGKTYYKTFWPHCLKLEKGGPSGIDVDQPPHSSHEWVVVVHRMEGSSQQVRKLAELAFDDAFGHPAGSRDA